MTLYQHPHNCRVGIIYIAINPCFNHLCKSGRTAKKINTENLPLLGVVKIVEERMRTLSNTSIPLPYQCYYAAEVYNPPRVENTIKMMFDQYRFSKEFFKISAAMKIKEYLQKIELRNVTIKEGKYSN